MEILVRPRHKNDVRISHAIYSSGISTANQLFSLMP